jgi:hypothetical protein
MCWRLLPLLVLLSLVCPRADAADPTPTVRAMEDCSNPRSGAAGHPSSVVLETGPSDACRPFLHLETLGGVALPAVGDRPESDLPPAMRYVLGGVTASVSVASLVGGIGLARATVGLVRSDAALSNTLGLLTGMLSAGSFGFAVAAAVWSVRLFRGDAVLTVSSRRSPEPDGHRSLNRIDR